jgi:hypothetical protein
VILDVKTHGPGKLFDADGGEILCGIWADTETGEVRQYIKENGSLKFVNGAIVIGTRTYPAPLRFQPMRRRWK